MLSAEAVLFLIYSENQIKSERPYQVRLQNGFWHVTGSLATPASGEPMFGGTFYVTISQWDARIVEIGTRRVMASNTSNQSLQPTAGRSDV